MKRSSPRHDLSLHGIYVETVKSIQKLTHDSNFSMGHHLWVEFLNKNVPQGRTYAEPTKNPEEYNVCFLGDFLHHVGYQCKDDASMIEVSSRLQEQKRRKVRGEEVLGLYSKIVYEKVCIVVGEDVLFSKNFRKDFVRKVALPMEFVVHSGVAVSMLMGALQSSLVSSILGVGIASNPQLYCVHFEGGFRNFPQTNDAASAHQFRFDNLNHVLRSFGVDSGATARAMNEKVRSILDQRLVKFIGIGTGNPGRPCFCIDIQRYVKYMCERNRKVMVDANLMLAVHASRNGEWNGIDTWWQPSHRRILEDLLRHYRLFDGSCLVLVLSPAGERLTPQVGVRINRGENIWAPPNR